MQGIGDKFTTYGYQPQRFPYNFLSGASITCSRPLTCSFVCSGVPQVSSWVPLLFSPPVFRSSQGIAISYSSPRVICSARDTPLKMHLCFLIRYCRLFICLFIRPNSYRASRICNCTLKIIQIEQAGAAPFESWRPASRAIVLDVGAVTFARNKNTILSCLECNQRRQRPQPFSVFLYWFFRRIFHTMQRYTPGVIKQ